MIYPVDFTRNSKDLLLELVNHDNELTLTFDDVDFIGAPTNSDSVDYNSKVNIRTKEPIFEYPEVVLHYNRIDLGHLFSVVGCWVQSLELDHNVDGSAIVNDKIYDEINRRYGLNVDGENFKLEQEEDGTIWISAVDGNLSYIGKKNIDIIPSFVERIQTTMLQGFSMRHYGSNWVLMPMEAYPVDVLVQSSEATFSPTSKFGGKWESLGKADMGINDLLWMVKPIGEPFPIYLNLNDVELPPVENELCTYIELSVDSPFNENKVTTVTINHQPYLKVTDQRSPFYGQCILAANTTGHFLRPSETGEVQHGMFERHTHKITVNPGGRHNHREKFGSGWNQPLNGIPRGGNEQNHDSMHWTDYAPAHSHSAIADNTGGHETRPDNIGVKYFMCIYRGDATLLLSGKYTKYSWKRIE